MPTDEQIQKWNAEALAHPAPIDPADLCRHGLHWEDCPTCYPEQSGDDVGGWSWLCIHGREGCPECSVPPRPEPKN